MTARAPLATHKSTSSIMEVSHLVLREFIDLFVAPASMERCVYLWEKPKRRSQLLEELLHDARSLHRDRRQEIESSLSEPEQLLALLHKKGAGQTCFVYGRSDFDVMKSTCAPPSPAG